MYNIGTKALPAGEALLAHCRVKVSSGTWVYADADNAGQGVTLKARASGEMTAAQMHNAGGSVEMKAAGAIAQGADAYAAADGEIQALPAGAGTYYKCGVALEAATADGDVIEVLPVGVGIPTVVT